MNEVNIDSWQGLAAISEQYKSTDWIFRGVGNSSLFCFRFGNPAARRPSALQDEIAIPKVDVSPLQASRLTRTQTAMNQDGEHREIIRRSVGTSGAIVSADSFAFSL